MSVAAVKKEYFVSFEDQKRLAAQVPLDEQPSVAPKAKADKFSGHDSRRTERQGLCETSAWKKSIHKSITLCQMKQKIQEHFNFCPEKPSHKNKGKKEHEKDKSIMELTKTMGCITKESKPCSLSKAPRFKDLNMGLSPGPGAYKVTLIPANKSFRRSSLQDFNHSLSNNHCYHVDPSALNPPPGTYNVHKESKPRHITPWINPPSPIHNRRTGKTPTQMYTPPSTMHELLRNNHKGPFLKSARFPKKEFQRNILALSADCDQQLSPASYNPQSGWKCGKKREVGDNACGNKKVANNGKFSLISQANKFLPATGRYDLTPIPVSGLFPCTWVFNSRLPKIYQHNNVYTKASSTRCVPHCFLYDTHNPIQ